MLVFRDRLFTFAAKMLPNLTLQSKIEASKHTLRLNPYQKLTNT